MGQEIRISIIIVFTLSLLLFFQRTQNDPKTTNHALQPPSGGSSHSIFFDASLTGLALSVGSVSIAVLLAFEPIGLEE